MNTTDKIKWAMSHCKCGLYVFINEHRDDYQTAEQYIDNMDCYTNLDVSDDVKAEMIEQNQIVNIKAYTQTPVGCFNVYHYDLNKALDELIECIKDEQNLEG